MPLLDYKELKFQMDFYTASEDSVQNTALKVSLAGTLILWVIFTITAVVIPEKKKPEYSTINIILDTPEVPEPKENKPVETQEAVNQPVEETKPSPVAPVQEEKAKTNPVKPVETKSAEAPKPASATAQKEKPSSQVSPKPVPAPQKSTEPSVQKPAATQKTDTVTSQASAPKKANITYKKSAEELMAEQLGSSNKKTEWDDSIFGEDTHSQTQTSTSPVTAPKQNAISGAAAFEGTSAISSGGAEKAVAKTDTASVSQTSSSTSSSLSNIARTVPNRHTYGEGISDESKVEMTDMQDGKSHLKMTDGSSRTLLDPKKPSIMISPENAAQIDNKRTVWIRFKVLAAGNVSEISFEPAALLPVEIQNEIREQISTWRFSPAPAESIARFEYSIIKR